MENLIKYHSFNIEIANIYGIEEAIILQNIAFWVEKNKMNNHNFHEGKYWTYNSAKAFQEIYFYMSEYKVKRVLRKLEEKKLVLVGNFNKYKYDRTKWYALTGKAISLLTNSIPKQEKDESRHEETLKSRESAKSTNGIEQNQQMESTESTNANCNNDQPIPVLFTDTNPFVNNNSMSKTQYQVVVDTKKEISKKETINVSEKTFNIIKEKTKSLLAKEDIQHILSKTGCTEQKLLEKVNLMLTVKCVKTPIGWLISAIKNDYKEQKPLINEEPANPRRSKNAFHDFQKNDKKYTNDELLKQLGVE